MMYMQTQTPIADTQKLLINSCRCRRRFSPRRLLVFIVRLFVFFLFFFLSSYLFENIIHVHIRTSRITCVGRKFYSGIHAFHRTQAGCLTVCCYVNCEYAASSNICRTCSGWILWATYKSFCYLLNACVVAEREWVGALWSWGQPECWP